MNGAVVPGRPEENHFKQRALAEYSMRCLQEIKVHDLVWLGRR
jgi:hypothetical protein